MKKQIIISLTLVTILSCTKTIKFDDQGLANQLVLNSIIYPNMSFSAYLTKSSSILEPATSTGQFTDGTLELYENGALIKQIYSPTGNFLADDIKPEAGKTYRIEVTSNGKKLEAETTIPNPTDVVSLDTLTIKNQFGQKGIKYTLKFKDPSGNDYYRIVLIKESLNFSSYTSDNGKRRYMLSTSLNSIDSDDPVFKSVYNNFGDELINYGPSNDYFIFPDAYFQGKEYALHFQVSANGFSNGYYPSGGSNCIYERNVIHIQKLSKDLYNYLKYLKLYNNYHDDPFSEPVPVYSNVSNGIGIFAGFNDDSQYSFEKIYIPYSMDTITVEDNPYPSSY